MDNYDARKGRALKLVSSRLCLSILFSWTESGKLTAWLTAFPPHPRSRRDRAVGRGVAALAVGAGSEVTELSLSKHSLQRTGILESLEPLLMRVANARIPVGVPLRTGREATHF